MGAMGTKSDADSRNGGGGNGATAGKSPLPHAWASKLATDKSFTRLEEEDGGRDPKRAQQSIMANLVGRALRGIHIVEQRTWWREHGDAIVAALITFVFTAIFASSLTVFLGRDQKAVDSWLVPKSLQHPVLPLPWSAGDWRANETFVDGEDVAAESYFRLASFRLPLPASTQTHEILWEPHSKTAFVTVPTLSKLIQVPFNGRGEMMSKIRWWTVGHKSKPHSMAGLHSVSASTLFPGSIWLSTETDNRIYLVDLASGYVKNGFTIRYTMSVPESIEIGGKYHHVGGPHTVREGPDGAVWVCLKGLKGEEPEYNKKDVADAYMREKREKMILEGIDPSEMDNMAYALWKVFPEQYDHEVFPARGGVLYPTGPSPTMAAFDGFGNVFVSLDASAYMMRVDAVTGEATNISLPSVLDESDGTVWDFSKGNGPGVVSGPDGSVWLSNLGARRPWLVRFLPNSVEPLVVKLSGPGDDRRIIHMAFSTKGGKSRSRNVLYALTSALLVPKADEAVMVQEFDANWTNPISDGEVGQNEIKLSTDHSAAHRIVVAENLKPRSILVTGLLTNSIEQISGGRI